MYLVRTGDSSHTDNTSFEVAQDKVGPLGGDLSRTFEDDTGIERRPIRQSPRED